MMTRRAAFLSALTLPLALAPSTTPTPTAPLPDHREVTVLAAAVAQLRHETDALIYVNSPHMKDEGPYTAAQAVLAAADSWPTRIDAECGACYVCLNRRRARII